MGFMEWLLGPKCAECGKNRTKEKFEGKPVCGLCRLKIRAEREPVIDCPIDGKAMRKELLSGMVIDRCPKCGGVWLDKGELRQAMATMISHGFGMWR